MKAPPIQLSTQAVAHIRTWLAKQDTPPQALRFGVRPSGCSGHRYVVAPAIQVGEQDTRFNSQGIDIVIDAESLPYLQGATVDFIQEGLNSGFRFDNPNATGTCGCGESFSLKAEADPSP